MALLAALKAVRHQPGDFEEYAGDLASLAGEQVVGSGFLFCNGVAVSRTTYAALFSAIGTKYGAGDGGTTFNLPDYRDRLILHRGPVKATVGATAGAFAHSHVFTHAHTIRGHVHSMQAHVHPMPHTHAYTSGGADPATEFLGRVAGGAAFASAGHSHNGSSGASTVANTGASSVAFSDSVADVASGSASPGSTAADPPHLVSGAVVIRF